MEVDPQTSNQPYTILRIKRKRNEEPLDALVIESRIRRKKSRGGLDIFQFAETVGPEAWQDQRRTRDLQHRISALAREQAIRLGAEQQPVAAASPTPSQLKPDAARQYTIVPQDEPERRPRPPTAPPKVLSSKDLEHRPITDFKLYDAVLAEPEPASPVDSEIENFLPMLQDYLKLQDNDITLPAASPPSAGLVRPSGSGQTLPSSASLLPTDDRDYVWDVFYHRAGLMNEFDTITNVATLTGLPSSFGDPYASDSESEEEDEADEDSNAEEYYKNDYPEEESSEDSGGSDMFHEQSGEEDDRAWR